MGASAAAILLLAILLLVRWWRRRRKGATIKGIIVPNKTKQAATSKTTDTDVVPAMPTSLVAFENYEYPSSDVRVDAFIGDSMLHPALFLQPLTHFIRVPQARVALALSTAHTSTDQALFVWSPPRCCASQHPASTHSALPA